MNLRFVKSLACPVCGCSLIKSERVEIDDCKIREHVNGGHWEMREFACGYVTQYVPNYMSEIMVKNCPADPALVAERKKKSDLKDQLIKIIQNSACSENYKENLISSICWR